MPYDPNLWRAKLPDGYVPSLNKELARVERLDIPLGKDCDFSEIKNIITSLQEGDENISGESYLKLFYTDVLDLATNKTYYIFSRPLAYFLGYEYQVYIGGGEVDKALIAQKFDEVFMDKTHEIDERINEIYERFKDDLQSKVDFGLANLNDNTLKIIAHKIIEILDINGTTINYSPTLASVKLFKNGEEVSLNLKSKNGALTGELSLNGTYSIYIGKAE